MEEERCTQRGREKERGNLFPLSPVPLPRFLPVAMAKDIAADACLESLHHVSRVPPFLRLFPFAQPRSPAWLGYFLRLPGLSAFIAYGDVGPTRLTGYATFYWISNLCARHVEQYEGLRVRYRGREGRTGVAPREDTRGRGKPAALSARVRSRKKKWYSGLEISASASFAAVKRYRRSAIFSHSFRAAERSHLSVGLVAARITIRDV